MWVAPLLALLAACPQPPPPAVDDTDDTDTPDTDPPDDTDATVDTGWLDDTDDVVDTADPDSSAPPADTSDSDAFTDTGACNFGEVADCAGACYPAHFVGDGTCDDGTTFASDFNCPSYRYDEGDCGGTGGLVTCDYIVRADVRNDPLEYGWTLRAEDGVVLADVRPGTYLDAWRTYDHPMSLASGHYTLIRHDELGDGWGGATLAVLDANNGEILVTGTFARPPDFDPLNPGLRSEAQEFDLVCGSTTPSCDVLVDVHSRAHGSEVGWQLRAPNGFVLRSGPPGSLGDFDHIRSTVSLLEGTYNFRMTDGGTGGWEGGHVELSHPGGYGIGFGALSGFSSGGFNFTVDCDYAAAPPLPAPTGPVAVSCSTVDLRVAAGPDGPDVGFTLYDEATYTALVTRDPGFFWSGTTTTVDTPLPASGRYVLSIKDGLGDGWTGTTARLFDAASGVDLLTPTLPVGHGSFAAFEVQCTDIAPDDTGEPPPPPSPCPTGAILDCDGTCWPASYRDDGHCDDGTTFAPDFMCAALGWDGGDCRP